MRRFIALIALAALTLAPAAAWAQASPFPVAQTTTLQNAAGATGNGTLMSTAQLAIVTIHTFGTFVGTVTYEATNDGSTFFALTCYTISGSSGVTTATAAAAVRCNVNGIAAIRGRVSAYTSGAITSVANGSSFGFPFAATNN